MQRVFNENLDQIYLKINIVLNEIKLNNYLILSALENYNVGELIELFRSLSIPLNQLKPFLNLFNSQKGSKIKWSNSVGIYNEIIREQNGFSFIKVNQKLEIPTLKIELVDQRPEKFDKQTYYFDPNRIIGDIRIRYWQRGDRMNPIGIKGSKLVSDIITDAKVPNAERARHLVICDDHKILACFGLCVDRRAIANDERQMLKVSLKN
jgi:tRNA(Ile)-lysidine synthetase-like protein